MKEEIIRKLKLNNNSLSTGELLNYLQDIAEQTIENSEFEKYIKKATADQRRCKGQDCVIINCRVFDWKEFNNNTFDVVDAFLNYFSKSSLQKMNNVI